jgi:hypothetical protein
MAVFLFFLELERLGFVGFHDVRLGGVACWVLGGSGQSGTTSQLPVKGAHMEPLVFQSQPRSIHFGERGPKVQGRQKYYYEGEQRGSLHAPQSAGSKHSSADSVPRTDTDQTPHPSRPRLLQRTLPAPLDHRSPLRNKPRLGN